MTEKVKLEEAKRLYQTANADQRYVLERLFPELADSEDERIRKALIRYHQSTIDVDGIEGKKIIAWLGKQGKQKLKKVPIWKHWKDGIAGNGEGKQTYLIKNGLIYSISSCLGHECDYIELSELDELMREEKQGMPKWTDEDERNMSKCKSVILFTKDGLSLNEKAELKRWLDSLKQRMEAQQ